MVFTNAPLGLVPAHLRPAPHYWVRRPGAPDPVEAAKTPPWEDPVEPAPVAPPPPVEAPAPVEATAPSAKPAPLRSRWRACDDRVCRRKRRCLGRSEACLARSERDHDPERMAYLYKLVTWHAGNGPKPPDPVRAAPAPAKTSRRRRPNARRRSERAAAMRVSPVAAPPGPL
ncbi:hypothetical protein [Methylopila sp. M107]|uniref:hypothetical protein n=1 Tax=Methylopila sp. M107 TaxID=1101190 RepID=UPI00036F201A|nr:hypothetical protein [Methylopila sp. M107]